MILIDWLKHFWNSFKNKSEHDLWKIYIRLLLLLAILNLIYAIAKN